MLGTITLMLVGASVSCFALAAVRGTPNLITVGVLDAFAAACCFIARSVS